MTLYKVLDGDKPCHGGAGRWPLPTNGVPGDWLTVEGPLVPCENGIHLCRENDLLDWLGPDIWFAEYDGELLESDNKVVVRKARLLRKTAWNARMARLFACDCAERVVRLVDDARCEKAIQVAREYARGQATDAELTTARDAAGDAAWAVAWAGAWAVAGDAAGDAARAAGAAGAAAGDAAWAAAWAAAGDAARAAGAVAWAAAMAAGAVAWAVAWAAAGGAAGAAAGDAAWDAARDAARDAERSWQTRHLLALIAGGGRDAE